MKTITFKSTRKGSFSINIPDDYKKIKLPFFNEWMSALKSGKYSQCTSRLCTPVENKKLGYCCLGVLSKIQGRLTKDEGNCYRDFSQSALYLSIDNPCYNVFSHKGNFPSDVFVEKTVKKETKKVTSLTECNDTLRLSFKDIAKIIEILYTT